CVTAPCGSASARRRPRSRCWRPPGTSRPRTASCRRREDRIKEDHMSDTHNLLLVRYGEIGLKGKNRSEFVSALVRQLRQRLEPICTHVQVTHNFGRIYVEWAGEDAEAVYRAVGRTFGVVSFSPAVRVPHDVRLMREA